MNDMQPRTVIANVKKEMGDRLVILGHHYQRNEILEYADYVGDSLELARQASAIKKADFIVFCGVYFMAETAAVLARDKAVYIPDTSAGCPLADMARIEDVNTAWKKIVQVYDSVIPVTYVNSAVSIKAFCGRHDGTVCTSGNARKIFEWAFDQVDKIFFVPDKNLGRNTARALGISEDEIVEWHPNKPGGGLDRDAIAHAKVILWDGWCPVHWPKFSKKAVEKTRKNYPDAKIIVHPESDPETVDASDASGSTAQIIQYVKKLRPGEMVAIGTEYNMVSRMAKDFSGEIDVIPLSRVLCDDMGKITLEKLASTLTSLHEDTYRVVVDENTARDAAKALETMLGA